ncbi:MAG: small subunit ribosomal protein [Patescibacteria group bacterium]|nr:small subunit ribosomal protein [Patescibacteria group bacterium]
MSTIKSEKYIEAIGRRKTASARVRITPAAKQTYEINGKNLETYFPTKELQRSAVESFAESKLTESKFKVSVVVKGGGISGQADAMRHGCARALIDWDIELRGKLKKAGLLKRDPRAKERRKFGLKKARKSPQWSKR